MCVLSKVVDIGRVEMIFELNVRPAVKVLLIQLFKRAKLVNLYASIDVRASHEMGVLFVDVFVTGVGVIVVFTAKSEGCKFDGGSRQRVLISQVCIVLIPI